MQLNPRQFNRDESYTIFETIKKWHCEWEKFYFLPKECCIFLTTKMSFDQSSTKRYFLMIFQGEKIRPITPQAFWKENWFFLFSFRLYNHREFFYAFLLQRIFSAIYLCRWCRLHNAFPPWKISHFGIHYAVLDINHLIAHKFRWSFFWFSCCQFMVMAL